MAGTGEKIEMGGRNKGSFKHRKDPFPPLVSIITATFNAEKDLEQCILSVLEQDYPHFEFIIIDGGSTDGTLDIIKKYDDRIAHWISEPDNGVFDALNKGIKLAHGEWLFFLGADDRLADRNVLKRIFSKPRSSKLVYGNVRWGKAGKIYDGKYSKVKLFHQNICQQAIFYHRDLFRKLGGFDTEYCIAADWVFNMKAFGQRLTKPIFIDTIVADYSADGISTNQKDPVFSPDREKIYRQYLGKFALFRMKLRHFFRL